MLFSLIRRPAAISSWSAALSNRLTLRSVTTTTNASLTHPRSTLSLSPSSLPSSSSSVFRRSNNRRSFSFGNEQLPPDDPQALFKPIPPTELNLEMAKGIQTANHLILKYGVGRQRLILLSKDNDMPLVIKWQRMMEVYLGAQLHVVAALGYSTDESGIMMYTQQLGQFVGTKCTQDQQEEFRVVGRETWREMLTIAFDLDQELINEKYGNELSIVDARNIVHKVASRLIEPNILEEVATRVSLLSGRKNFPPFFLLFLMVGFSLSLLLLIHASNYTAPHTSFYPFLRLDNYHRVSEIFCLLSFKTLTSYSYEDIIFAHCSFFSFLPSVLFSFP
jgi:hypothetical protein